MKEQIKTTVPRRKFVVGGSDEHRKTATGHSCKPLAHIKTININYKLRNYT